VTDADILEDAGAKENKSKNLEETGDESSEEVSSGALYTT
jgi:hypothetical protein